MLTHFLEITLRCYRTGIVNNYHLHLMRKYEAQYFSQEVIHQKKKRKILYPEVFQHIWEGRNKVNLLLVYVHCKCEIEGVIR
mmetsp:Transcript_29489/g.43103  ORF Transcript_29489/g.43103 Transcript_29489/m.43103 type:complete len:82 (-) Transcript_29489:988-1233(-)